MISHCPVCQAPLDSDECCDNRDHSTEWDGGDIVRHVVAGKLTHTEDRTTGTLTTVSQET
jgi:hypothetical protein